VVRRFITAIPARALSEAFSRIFADAEHRVDDHPVADTKIAHASADLGDDACHFVTKHNRCVMHPGDARAFDDADIRMTQARGLDVQKNLICSRNGIG
jgi:hypothetical protein